MRHPAGRRYDAGRVPQEAPLNLIHINNSPNPMLARVSGRFAYSGGVSVDDLLNALRLPFPLAVELLRRASK